MGYYSMLACMMLAMAAVLGRKRRMRWVYALGVVMAYYGLSFTLNRGALTALILGSAQSARC